MYEITNKQDLKKEIGKKIQSVTSKFGMNLRKRRRDLDLTLSEVGELTDVSHSYIGNLERGAKMPSLEIIIKLSYVLKVNVSWLLGEEDMLPNGMTYLEIEDQLKKFNTMQNRLKRLEELEKKEQELEQIKKILGK